MEGLQGRSNASGSEGDRYQRGLDTKVIRRDIHVAAWKPAPTLCELWLGHPPVRSSSRAACAHLTSFRPAETSSTRRLDPSPCSAANPWRDGQAGISCQVLRCRGVRRDAQKHNAYSSPYGPSTLRCPALQWMGRQNPLLWPILAPYLDGLHDKGQEASGGGHRLQQIRPSA